MSGAPCPAAGAWGWGWRWAARTCVGRGEGLREGVDGGSGTCVAAGEGASCACAPRGDGDIGLWSALLAPVPCVLAGAEETAGTAFRTAKRLVHSVEAWFVRRRRAREERRRDQSWGAKLSTVVASNSRWASQCPALW